MPLGDKERFEKFMELLPEQAVENFASLLLLHGKFLDEQMGMFFRYDAYSTEILSQFHDKKINEKWKTFNASFEALQSFLQEHYTSPNGFYPKHSPEWEKFKDEMDNLVKDFEEKYTNFVFLTKEELEVVVKSKKIIIKIDTARKTIARETSGGTLEYQFRKSDGINKRFGYIIMIAQNPKVGAKKLSNASYQSISSEIIEINTIIKQELKLTQDLIINEGNSGYEINKPYEIELS